MGKTLAESECVVDGDAEWLCRESIIVFFSMVMEGHVEFGRISV